MNAGLDARTATHLVYARNVHLLLAGRRMAAASGEPVDHATKQFKVGTGARVNGVVRDSLRNEGAAD